MTLEDRINVIKKITLYSFIFSFVVSFFLIISILSLLLLDNMVLETKFYIAIASSIFISFTFSFVLYKHMKNIDEIDELIIKFCNYDNNEYKEDCRLLTIMKIIMLAASICFLNNRQTIINKDNICSNKTNKHKDSK